MILIFMILIIAVYNKGVIQFLLPSNSTTVPVFHIFRFESPRSHRKRKLVVLNRRLRYQKRGTVRVPHQVVSGFKLQFLIVNVYFVILQIARVVGQHMV